MQISLRFVVALVAGISAMACTSEDTNDTTAAESDDAASETTTSEATTSGTTTSGTTTSETTTGSGGDPVAAYCMCVFANCHDAYHMKWGEDEVMAEQNCLQEAGALPQNGAPIAMGDFLECRQYYCDVAATDPSVCSNALGDGECM